MPVKKNVKKDNVERTKTGIPGFDENIQGGLVKNSLNLVSGGPGCGKTIFCLQFIYNGIIQEGENGLIISFDEYLDSLKKDARNLGMEFDEFEKEKKCTFMALDPFQNSRIKEDIITKVKNNNIKRVAIDSTSVFSMAIDDTPYSLRREFYRLASLLRKLNCTTVMTAEIAGEASLDISQGGAMSRDGIVEFIADTVITLHNSGIGGEADRAIRIVKMRRTNHRRDPMPMRITDNGLVVENSSF